MRWKKTVNLVEAHAKDEIGRVVTGGIQGFHQIGLDPSDPYPEGYKVADCWGDAFDLLK